MHNQYTLGKKNRAGKQKKLGYFIKIVFWIKGQKSLVEIVVEIGVKVVDEDIAL